MQYIIAVFKNRTHCYSFLTVLSSYTKSAKIVNTPSQIGLPCSISVAFNPSNIAQAKYVLSRRHYSSFMGFYSVLQTNTTLRIVPAF